MVLQSAACVVGAPVVEGDDLGGQVLDALEPCGE
jgi:hypothetical protein